MKRLRPEAHRGTAPEAARTAGLLILFALGCLPAGAVAQGGFAARGEERRKEGWYFSDHLGAKKESSRLDLLYRFYTSQNRKPRPRVEPLVYGLGFTAHARESASTLGPTPASSGGTNTAAPAKVGYKGSGYGGEIFLNNFVSGGLGIPTLNIVPGVRGERREDDGHPSNASTTTWGPVVRVLGAHHQDSSLVLCYCNVRRSVLGEAFGEWAWRGGGKLYLAPFLALDSEAWISQDVLRGKPSPRFSHRGFHVGGFLDISVVRLGFRFERDEFEGRSAETTGWTAREERRVVFLGLAY